MSEFNLDRQKGYEEGLKVGIGHKSAPHGCDGCCTKPPRTLKDVIKDAEYALMELRGVIFEIGKSQEQQRIINLLWFAITIATITAAALTMLQL